MLGHPGGGVMKYTFAHADERHSVRLGSQTVESIRALIRKGASEPGSSGSGIFKSNYLIGVLAGGSGSYSGDKCHNENIYFGTLSRFYHLVKHYLDPEIKPQIPLAYFLPADAEMESVARIVSRSDPGDEDIVTVNAWDDAGNSYGPIELFLYPNSALEFNSNDLELGNPDKDLHRGIGDGEGNWRLAFSSYYPLSVTGYLRASDGFQTSMHAVVPESDELVYEVPFFAPHGTWNQRPRSWLRLSNPNRHDVDITISGIDDDGISRGKVDLGLAPESSRMVSDEQLERGGDDLDGFFSNGRRNWHLSISATRPILVMNLLKSPTGHVTNISAQAPLVKVQNTNPLVQDPYKPKSNPPPLDPEPEQPPPRLDPDVPTMDVPPVPVDLTADAGIGVVLLFWDNGFAFYTNHGLTRVYRHTANEFNNAIYLGMGPGISYIDRQVADDTTYYYWIRWESMAGILGPPSESVEVRTAIRP